MNKLFASIVITFCLAACQSIPQTTTPAQKTVPTMITTTKVLDLLDKDEVVIVDVRPKQDRKTFPSAYGIHYLQFGPTQWTGKISGRDEENFLRAIYPIYAEAEEAGKMIVLMCDEGVRARVAAQLLHNQDMDVFYASDANMITLMYR
ncbi:MAG: hypothetical protein JWN37_789 [Candidatus Nomurabacteria bacterium]|nr:hypothetical protein [Candidatus Nomurabacteria bacterium]